MFLVGFPLLIVALALYNMVAFFILAPPPAPGWAMPVYTFHLPSGVDWTATYSDVMIAVALFLLFIEVAKATGAKSIVDHLLSFIVFAGALAEFLLVPQVANSTLAVLIFICFVDLIAGIAIRVRIARRARREVPVAAAPVEPPFEHHQGVPSP